MKNLILIGGGGHCRVVLDVIKEGGEFNVIGIIDVKEKIGNRVNGVEIIDSDENLSKYFENGIEYAFIALGSVGNPTRRILLYKKVREIGFKVPAIVSNNAVLSKNVFWEDGVFINKGVMINDNVSIKSNAIINTGSIIEHDCDIGEFVHISPGSVLSGNVSIGKNSHIGTNATVIQGIKIGENSIVGAGAVVTKNVLSNTVVVGNPARFLRFNSY